MLVNRHMNIDGKARGIVYAAARRAYPDECCGFLWGHGNTVSFAAEAGNVSEGDKKSHFAIHPASYMAAELFAEQNGLSLLGVFHSHPDDPAVPSCKDLEMALPNFLYFIVSVSKLAVLEERCWALNDTQQFEELLIRGSLLESSQT